VLGGGIPGVDILTRSHVYLFEAVDLLLRRRPELRSAVEIHLAGVVSHADREITRDADFVKVHGYLPHGESIALIRSADLLFLPMQNLPSGQRSTTVPGKTYEYLASGRPILAAIPDGDARDILEAAGIARFAAPDDVDAMAGAIANEVQRWRAGTQPSEPPAHTVARFERQYLAEELASLVDSITGLGGAASPVDSDGRLGTAAAPAPALQRQSAT
jgi:glycosyltransferase involved in cell wall biosynthesis